MSKSYKHMSDENVQRHRDTQRGRKNKSLLAGWPQCADGVAGGRKLPGNAKPTSNVAANSRTEPRGDYKSPTLLGFSATGIIMLDDINKMLSNHGMRPSSIKVMWCGSGSDDLDSMSRSWADVKLRIEYAEGFVIQVPKKSIFSVIGERSALFTPDYASLLTSPIKIMTIRRTTFIWTMDEELAATLVLMQ